MNPLKFKRVEIRPPRYDPHPEKSQTNNSDWRKGLFIIFEDRDGALYDYMPTWAEVSELNRQKGAIEDINGDLARLSRVDVAFQLEQLQTVVEELGKSFSELREYVKFMAGVKE